MLLLLPIIQADDRLIGKVFSRSTTGNRLGRKRPPVNPDARDFAGSVSRRQQFGKAPRAAVRGASGNTCRGILPAGIERNPVTLARVTAVAAPGIQRHASCRRMSGEFGRVVRAVREGKQNQLSDALFNGADKKSKPEDRDYSSSIVIRGEEFWPSGSG
jgi:hypothetical protein